VAISWNGATTNAQIYADATNVCLRVTNGVSAQETCGAPGVAWATASKHTLKACMTPAGLATVYGDGVILNSSAHAFVPDLQGGSVHVGEGDAGTWEGYVSRARVCRNTGVPADCN
jgi:hypothetical protein